MEYQCSHASHLVLWHSMQQTGSLAMIESDIFQVRLHKQSRHALDKRGVCGGGGGGSEVQVDKMGV